MLVLPGAHSYHKLSCMVVQYGRLSYGNSGLRSDVRLTWSQSLLFRNGKAESAYSVTNMHLQG
jgi:hypothetical protein